MNAEKQRIKIAEACGWTDVMGSKFATVREYWHGQPIGFDPARLSHGPQLIPNYLGDRTAMHEALATMTERQWCEFFAWLYAGLGDGSRAWGTYGYRKLIEFYKAPLEKVSEAFLKTLGLWEEGE